ncbi:MAG: gliding motility-associated C-terminal domain-containing protein, partial [Bacteroidota bacterium]
YYVKVIDGNGCEVIENARISQPSKLEVEYTTEDCQCYGDDTGQINLAVEGGTGEYSYEWSNGETTRNLSDIPAGEYEVIVTDEAGCSVAENMKIEQPTPVEAEITDSGGPLCFGDEGGYVKTSVHGGTTPYRYEWNNGASSSNLKDVGPGEYALTVTDDKGCSSEVSVEITGPEELTGVLSIEEEISCYKGDDGAVGLELSGGVGPYEIKWYGENKSFSESSSRLSGLESGLYRAVVQDANGCSWKDSVRLTAPSEPFFVELNEYHLSCHGGDDGAIDVEVHNGTAPFNFTWSNGLKTRDASGLTSGKHAVSVTDAKGCEAEASTVLLEPPKITAETLINAPSCKDADDGSAEIVLSGGNSPYTVEWSNGTSGNKIEELNAGFYSARVTDNNLCVQEFEVEIPLTDKACVDIPTAYTPNGDGINDTWEIRGIEFYPGYTIKVFSKWGDLIYSASAGDASWDGTFKGEKLQAASYYYVIDLGDGSTPFKGLVTIIR